jgi:uncharacterized protein
MKRVFIIHGWEGNPNDGWKRWLRAALEKEGYKVIAPQMPNAEMPQMAEWISTLSELVGKPDKDSYFVGHSLGCIAILRYLETLEEGDQVGGCVLVAGFIDDLGIRPIRNFLLSELDAKKVKKRCRNFVVISSEKDPYIPFEKTQHMIDALGAKFVLEKGKGHITETYELQSALDSLLSM